MDIGTVSYLVVFTTVFIVEVIFTGHVVEDLGVIDGGIVVGKGV